jgi:osmotically-inducible protein OsmY
MQSRRTNTREPSQEIDMPSNHNGGRSVLSRDENRPSWRAEDDVRGWEDRDQMRDREDDRMFDRDRDRDRDRGERGRWGRMGRHWEDDRDEGMRGRGEYAMRDFDDEGFGRRGGREHGGHFEDRQIGDRWGRGEHWQDRGERMGERGMREMGMQERGMQGSRYRGGMRGQGGYNQGQGGYQGGMYGRDQEQHGGRYGQGQQGMPGYGRQSMYGSQEGWGRQGPAQGHGGGYGLEGRGHRGKGPIGYQRSDERVREIVCEVLTEDDNIDASRIEVHVKNGEVILSGSVDDRDTKRLAEEVIDRLPGVRDVQNQLRVQERRGNQTQGPMVGKTESDKHRA